MSFTNNTAIVGKAYAPGFFLAHEECVRITTEADATNAAVKTAANGGKYLPMGIVYPSNDGNAIGIIYEDVDVTSGNMPASLVTKGVVYEDRLPEAVNGAAKTALAGITFTTVPTVTR